MLLCCVAITVMVMGMIVAGLLIHIISLLKFNYCSLRIYKPLLEEEY